ncbi:unnamed protein product [Rotaria sordida]|uniref:Cytochrome P450 n=1 Tax=Rotaria sordida TaxID=392033 RepID=A0A814J865_9BILA|nr:unnamed protein product [Rotaria sordida]CAF1032461.1 unnamed protein product [Rotaria sordida]
MMTGAKKNINRKDIIFQQRVDSLASDFNQNKINLGDYLQGLSVLIGAKILRELSEQIVEQEQNKHNDCESQRPKNLITPLVSSLNEQANDEQISSSLIQTEIFDEVLMAITAGTETTSKALSWFMFYMSKHPRVQQRIKQELKEHDLVMGDNAHSSSLSIETLESLVYYDCVLRLAPVIGITTRRAIRDAVVDGVSIHRDPTEFIPERFLFEDKNHHPYAMVTFDGGHRACLS